jgi:hypothetical protein
MVRSLFLPISLSHSCWSLLITELIRLQSILQYSSEDIYQSFTLLGIGEYHFAIFAIAI